MKTPIRHFFILLQLVSLAVTTVPAVAAPLEAPHALPAALQAWVPWVLHTEKEATCPFLHGGATRQCIWGGPLQLDLHGDGGTFAQTWTVASASAWIPMPGSEQNWPVEGVVNGTAMPILPHNGMPSLHLAEGTHRLVGRFRWHTPPETMVIPAQVGIVSLAMFGEAVPFPNWLDARHLRLTTPQIAQGTDVVELSAHRRLDDGIPLILTTHLLLQVGGKDRELTIPPFLPEGFWPMQVESALPSRIDGDGRLRVQLRAGIWSVNVKAYHATPAETIERPAFAEPWPATETWVFAANPRLRTVRIEGPTAIDPQQTTLPEAWKSLPTYVVEPATPWHMVEEVRGLSEQPVDQVQLRRDLWLDFDGQGMTVKDDLTGTLHSQWRLDTDGTLILGHARLDGVDQLITTNATNGRPGIEVRNETLRLAAESRVESKGRRLSVGGWSMPLQGVWATLHLPPGWRLFATRGVDDAGGTWVGQWSLFDFFLLLITAIAFFKLWGPRWGIVALVTLTLLFHEPYAPVWIWLPILACEALHRLLPHGWGNTIARLGYLLGLVTLVIWSIPFAIQQGRQAIAPSLEHRIQGHAGVSPLAAPAEYVLAADGAVPAPQTTGDEAPLPAEDVTAASEKEDTQLNDRARPKALEVKSYSSSSLARRMEPAPSTLGKIQTGPGIPSWSWHTYPLIWNSPVDTAQTFRLFLLSPLATRLVTLCRLALLLLLMSVFLQKHFQPLSSWFRRQRGLPLALLALGLATLWNQPAMAQVTAGVDFPPSTLLDELRGRLLEPAPCRFDCASLTTMHVESTMERLRIGLDVHVGADTGVPIPGNRAEWTPEEIVVDHHMSGEVFMDTAGTLWLHLMPGVHHVLLEGELPAHERVTVSLPLPARHVTMGQSAWLVEGIDTHGTASANLQLVRKGETADTSENAATVVTAMAPFLRVTRQLSLGLTWEIETTVERLTFAGTPVVLSVPLIAGETVTTPTIKTTETTALIQLAPNAHSATWHSILAEHDQVVLQAPDGVPWVETWLIDASPYWHVDFANLPRVAASADTGTHAPLAVWQPWPGESVQLHVTRPEAVSGTTMTVDRAILDVRPGHRASDVELRFTARSSLGDRYTLDLPNTATIQRVTIGGIESPLQAHDGRVTIPVTPGEEEIIVAWRESRGMSTWYRTSLITTTGTVANAMLNVFPPANRWILFTGGPRLGPSVLFWGYLLVLVVMASALGRFAPTPLRTHQWLLLGLGLSQIPAIFAAIVVGWFLLLARRERQTIANAAWFNVRQLVLLFWTFVTMIVLYGAIHAGLLGTPDMQIAGNDSSRLALHWFLDRPQGHLPQGWLFSLPMWTYRVAMLVWALWLANALLGWLRWGWRCLHTSGFWREMWQRREPLKP
ncbi:MAG: hypothetical protein HYV02_00225 [Deltaproteobacteria bacterium]|nr:hypothetical protein [Deltaproteobacteria bacterium]